VHFETSADIDASADVVWAIWSEVERWPEWTASVTRAERLDDGPLRVGSRVRIKQPRLPAVVWRVTKLDEGRSWTWVARGVGFSTEGGHRVEPSGDGRVRATASVDLGGPAAPFFGRLSAGITRRYIAIEAAGLKARCEGGRR
jgi:uncharacterized membrane protein